MSGRTGHARFGRSAPVTIDSVVRLLADRAFVDPDWIMKPDRVNVLGVGISAVNMERAVAVITRAIENGEKGYICVTGVHGVMECQDDPSLREIHNRALMCTPDGMPMVWIGKLGRYRGMGRVYGPDLMLDVCEASVARGVRHFFYGGANGCAEELKRRLTTRFPALQVVGVYERRLRCAEAEDRHDHGDASATQQRSCLCSHPTCPGHHEGERGEKIPDSR